MLAGTWGNSEQYMGRLHIGNWSHASGLPTISVVRPLTAQRSCVWGKSHSICYLCRVHKANHRHLLGVPPQQEARIFLYTDTTWCHLYFPWQNYVILPHNTDAFSHTSMPSRLLQVYDRNKQTAWTILSVHVLHRPKWDLTRWQLLCQACGQEESSSSSLSSSSSSYNNIMVRCTIHTTDKSSSTLHVDAGFSLKMFLTTILAQPIAHG